jgi:hypothetical protein
MLDLIAEAEMMERKVFRPTPGPFAEAEKIERKGFGLRSAWRSPHRPNCQLKNRANNGIIALRRTRMPIKQGGTV